MKHRKKDSARNGFSNLPKAIKDFLFVKRKQIRGRKESKGSRQKNVVFVSRKHDERYLYHRIVYLIKEMQAEKQKSKKKKMFLQDESTNN